MQVFVLISASPLCHQPCNFYFSEAEFDERVTRMLDERDAALSDAAKSKEATAYI